MCVCVRVHAHTRVCLCRQWGYFNQFCLCKLTWYPCFIIAESTRSTYWQQEVSFVSQLCLAQIVSVPKWFFFWGGKDSIFCFPSSLDNMSLLNSRTPFAVVLRFQLYKSLSSSVFISLYIGVDISRHHVFLFETLPALPPFALITHHLYLSTLISFLESSPNAMLLFLRVLYSI